MTTQRFNIDDEVRLPSGQVVVIDDINAHPDDFNRPNLEDEYLFAYRVEPYGGGGDENSWEGVTLVRSATDRANRKLPTAEHIAGELMLLDDFDGFEVDETERDGTSIIAYGKTDEGLRFNFRVSVSSIQENDF